MRTAKLMHCDKKDRYIIPIKFCCCVKSGCTKIYNPRCVSKQATFFYDYENFFCYILSVVSNQYIGEGQNAILL